MIFPLLLFQWTSLFSFMTLSLAHHIACYGALSHDEGLLLLWEQNIIIVIHLLNFTLEKNCARKVETDSWYTYLLASEYSLDSVLAGKAFKSTDPLQDLEV